MVELKLSELVSSDAKSLFLKKYGKRYGYDGKIDSIRAEEYPHMNGLTYLDFAASTTYPQSLIKAVANDLINPPKSLIYSNPHSGNSCGVLTQKRVDKVRAKILKHFETDSSEYSVIFTQNATASLQMVAESFPWYEKFHSDTWNSVVKRLNAVYYSVKYFMFKLIFGDKNVPLDIRMDFELHSTAGKFIMLNDNHTSVVGIREIASANNFMTLTYTNCEMQQFLDNSHLNGSDYYNLLAFPAQSNFDGTRYPLQWTKLASSNSNGKILTVLDATAFVSSSTLSLKDYPVDFLCLSFYKMFGYPSNLGALFVKNSTLNLMKKRYFGGGTVKVVTVGNNEKWKIFKDPSHELFENGTPGYLEIMSLEHAFESFERIYGSFDNISIHTECLREYLFTELDSLSHYNGTKVVQIYQNDSEVFSHGPVIAFNLKDSKGYFIPYTEVELLASGCNIYLRAGGVCNSGAMQASLDLSSDFIQSAYTKKNRVCGDRNAIFEGKALGVVRVSLGSMTTFEDVQALIVFLNKIFVETHEPYQLKGEENTNPQAVYLKEIIIYPVKSCQGYYVSSWNFDSRGLLYDRLWALKEDDTGKTMIIKGYPKMAQIQTRIDLELGLLVLNAPQMPQLTISLDKLGEDLEANAWFSRFLDKPCRLIRKDTEKSFAYKSAYLLINKSSLDALAGEDQQFEMGSFRPNLVVVGASAFSEDSWKVLKVGKYSFRATLNCERCAMVSYHPTTGERVPQTIKALNQKRKIGGAWLFGKHVETEDSGTLTLGDKVEIVELVEPE
ncbi:hypothetical protein MP638_003913 [Amoeboaphelidium occidentale]|nr:hypothetical protein MP638_003913 [Amoeboaphelidium occidentale]